MRMWYGRPTMQTAAPDVLRDLFHRSAIETERTVAWVRLGMCAFGILNVGLATQSSAAFFASGPKYPFMLLALMSVAGFSVWVLLRGSETRAIQRLMMGSVLVDALTALGIVGASVIWPSAHWRGLLAIPHAFGFPLAVAVSGLRLSRRAVVLSAFLNVGSALGLLAYDASVNGPKVHHSLDDYSLYFILIGISLAAACANAGRTRALVRSGGEALIRAERARQALGMYVSPLVADAALEVTTLRPGGERRVVAVLFADLRDFTAWSATLPPERLVVELNAWLEAMVQVIREEGGVVDKYIGDAIMAVWGIPSARPDDAQRAVRAAWRMQTALDAHNRIRQAHGLRPLRQGVGVHFGEGIAGNVGTTDRLQYTVMGDAVNLAARLEQITKDVGEPVVVSEAAARAAGAIPGLPPLVAWGTTPVRGRDTATGVYVFDTAARPTGA